MRRYSPWTDEVVSLLHQLWLAGVSTKEMPGLINEKFGLDINKNKVIGKVHRLQELFPEQWVGRPSPIRGKARPEKPKILPPDEPVETLPPLRSLTIDAPFVDRPPPFPITRPSPLPLPTSLLPAILSNIHVEPKPRPQRPFQLMCDGQNPSGPIRRPDGSGCLFLLAGAACDKDLYDRRKPYCEEHGKVCYVPKPKAQQETDV